MAEDKKTRKYKNLASGGGGDMVYCLGIIGSAVFYVQQATGFWEVILALAKALVWPAFVVYDILKYIS
jgi:hypothetical protein